MITNKIFYIDYFENYRLDLETFANFSYNLSQISTGVIPMTRMSKQGKRRHMCPKKRKPAFAEQTGPKKDNLENGFKAHENASGTTNVFISKIK